MHTAIWRKFSDVILPKVLIFHQNWTSPGFPDNRPVPVKSKHPFSRQALWGVLGGEIATTSLELQGQFSLQAGAFGNYDNARRLADQIESIGYTTIIKERPTSNKTLYLIWVGDYPTKTAAMSVADMLEAALGIQSFPVAINWHGNVCGPVATAAFKAVMPMENRWIGSTPIHSRKIILRFLLTNLTLFDVNQYEQVLSSKIIYL